MNVRDLPVEHVLLIGATFGELMSAKLDVVPILDGTDYTDEILLNLSEPFEGKKVVLTVRPWEGQ